MAIGVIATIKVQEGKNAAFEEEFAKLAKQVNANEPNCTFYVLHRSKTDTQTYKVLEQYNSAADLDAHGKTDYFAACNKVLGTMVAAAPDVEVLDTI